MKFHPAVLAPVLLLAIACSEPESPEIEPETPPADPAEPADMVLLDGTVLTVDPDRPEAEALAVADGRILAVGSTTEIREHVDVDTEVIELDGRIVTPGFIEGHGHFLGLGEAMMTLDLQDARSFDEIIEQVAEAAEQAEPGTWILGRGWHQERWDPPPEEAWDGVPPHREMSRVSPDNPVLLTHASGHASFANAAALDLAEIDRDSEDPDGGTIVRDDEGEPTGFLRQAAQLPVREARDRDREAMSDSEREAEFREQVELAGEEALRHGVTSFHDQGTGFEDIDRLRELAEAGELPIRLHVAVRGESIQDMREQLDEYRTVGHGDGFLTVRAIKQQLDGALGTHGAWMLDPYEDQSDTSGLPQLSLEDLRETAEVALEHEYQLNTHAIGDRANREVLDLYEAVLGEAEEDADLRWRIEHAQNLHPDDVPRFAELGITASMQGIHATSDGPWVPRRIGEDRAAERAYVWRSLLDSGALICNGTDVPVEPISPMASLHASITREMADGEAFYPDQSMERLEALESYTINCARAVFEEHQLGSIAPGKRADLAVLDENLLTVPENELRDVQVELTIVGGQVRFSLPQE